jgi:hypothetical protein
MIMEIQDMQTIQDMTEKQAKHEFHFLIPRSMKKKLRELTVFKKPIGFSKTVKKILSALRPAIKVEHKWGEQQMSRYRYVSDDKNEVRDHVCAYLDEDVYRELKSIHQDLNFYSIGQIIRDFLDFFLVLVEEYGDDVFSYLESTYKEWEETADLFRLTFREEMRQLRYILHRIEGGRGHLAVYDDTFTPFYIRRF